jgi:hypothetical protein
LSADEGGAKFLLNVGSYKSHTALTSQKTPLFIVTAVKNSNLIQNPVFISLQLFGPKRDEVTGGWRKLHNEELHNLYSSLNIFLLTTWRKMRWVGHVARMGRKGNVYRLFVRRPEGKRPLGRSRHRWTDNVKKYIRDIGWGSMDWIGLAQDRYRWRALVNAVMNLRVP